VFWDARSMFAHAYCEFMASGSTGMKAIRGGDNYTTNPWVYCGEGRILVGM
jgi:hypothetical protein